jgi:DNA-binding MarR family transcriptional regulator
LETEKWEEILKGFRNLRRLLQREAEKYGYSSTEIQILYQLHIKSRNVTELSELIGIGKSSVTEIIEKMEKRGLVSKIKSENDKRFIIIQITTEGEKALEQTRKEYKEIISSILNKVNTDEVIKFFKEVEKELDR